MLFFLVCGESQAKISHLQKHQAQRNPCSRALPVTEAHATCSDPQMSTSLVTLGWGLRTPGGLGRGLLRV